MSEHPIGHQDRKRFLGEGRGSGPGNCLIPRHISPSRPLDYSLGASLQPEYAFGLDLDLDTQPGAKERSRTKTAPQHSADGQATPIAE